MLFASAINISNFRVPILDITPKKIHERSSIFLGSKEDVEEVMAVIKKHDDAEA